MWFTGSFHLMFHCRYYSVSRQTLDVRLGVETGDGGRHWWPSMPEIHIGILVVSSSFPWPSHQTTFPISLRWVRFTISSWMLLIILPARCSCVLLRCRELCYWSSAGNQPLLRCVCFVLMVSSAVWQASALGNASTQISARWFNEWSFFSVRRNFLFDDEHIQNFFRAAGLYRIREPVTQSSPLNVSKGRSWKFWQNLPVLESWQALRLWSQVLELCRANVFILKFRSLT